MKISKLIIVAALSLIVYSEQTQAEIRSAHCPIGCPALDIPDSDVIFNFTYALSLNEKTKLADWVAYKVDVRNFGPSPGRDWKNNPLVDEQDTLEENDYKGASKALKVDKGHQAPLAAFAGAKHWYELNYLSNITPQKSALNQGPWRILEAAVRDAVKYSQPLYVVTGTLYNDVNSNPTLPKADEEHAIPDAYFKVIYNEKGESASFVMKQRTARDFDFCNTKVTFANLKSKLGFSMPSLKDSTKVVRQLGCN